MAVLQKTHDHYVNFYDGEDDLVAAVGPYLSEGLRGGEMALVIATEPHRRVFAEYLANEGIPVGLLEDQGVYVALDAATVLRSFVIDGTPHSERFRSAVAPFALAAAAKHRRLRAFGEMVGILWKSGNVRGAVRLEEMWNEVIDEYGLSLYCAYSARMFADTRELQAAADICLTHSHVVSPSHYTSDFAPDPPADCVTRSYLPTPEALIAARGFVLTTLQAWGHTALSVDAVSLATAQLVTAVLHDNLRPFRVTLRRESQGVRVEIEHPADQAEHQDLISPIALLVPQLAQEWGADTKQDTKVVWATFAA